jgi:hypothetical protein
MMTIAQKWINGEWVGLPTVPESFKPATGEILGHWASNIRTSVAIAAAVSVRPPSQRRNKSEEGGPRA